MKQIRGLIIVSLIFLLTSCELDIVREFPRVWTLDAVQLDGGVILKGKILNLKDLEIDDYGFLWGIGEFDEESDPNFVSLMDGPQADLFELKITNGIFAGREYYFMAYAISNSYLSLGTPNSFVSRGCDPPEIISFYPQTGFAGDIVSIRCGNIIGPLENYSVMFDNRVATIYTITNQTIEVIVPHDATEAQSVISVSAFSQTSVFEEPFEYIRPVIESISPKQVYMGQEVDISGSDLGNENSWLRVFFNGHEANITFRSNSLIKVLAPFPTDSLNTITVKAGLTATASDKIGYKFPFTTAIIPPEALPGELITVYGAGIGYVQPWNAAIGGHWSSIISVSTDYITLRVPDNIIGCDAEVKFYYNEPNGQLVCEEKFNLPQPEIVSFSNIEIDQGGELIIDGNNFLNDYSPSLISVGDSLIYPLWQGNSAVVYIPSDFPPGDYVVGVRAAFCDSFTYSPQLLKVK